MKYLIEAARQYGLEDIAEQALKNSSVHGIIVDIHPLWLISYKQYISNPNRPREWDVRYLFDYLLGRWDLALSEIYALSYDTSFSTIIPFDLSWRPEDWKNVFGNRNNLLIRIQLRPGSKSLELNSNDSRMTIVQEHSPVMEFASAKQLLRPLEGGVSIGHASDLPGTLGGILTDAKGQKFGLTCGHVIRNVNDIVDQPSMKDNSSFGSIGQSIYNCLPKPNNGTLCNTRNISSLNDMDVALIELDPQIPSNHSILNVGNVNGCMNASALHPNLRIEYNGRSSGYQQMLITGGIGFVQEIEDTHTASKSCFKNLIEIKQPSLLKLMCQRPVKGGDSGAWIVANGASGVEWAGMIIGENRQAGYAIHSEDILDHLNANGFQLMCT